MPDTVLVTGGAGYVGSHVVVQLAHAGFAPVVLDNFTNSTPAVLTRLEALSGRPVPCVNADVRDVVALRAAFHDHPIAAVIHCAGLKTIAESEERPLAFYDVNVGGALSLIEIMGEAGVATLVFSSSAAVYGQPDTLPVSEEAALLPRSVYGRTKRVVADFLRDLARANANWRIAIVRSFNAAGAHSSGMLGATPRGRPTELFVLLARVAAGELSEIPVCGNDCPPPTARAFATMSTSGLGGRARARASRLAAATGALTVNRGRRPRSLRPRGYRRVRARLRPADRSPQRAAAGGGHRRVLRRPQARRIAWMASDARPRRDLRRRLAVAESRGTSLETHDLMRRLRGRAKTSQLVG
jgi:NAD(P)-dependent dehydrogenase (short-subunit alcohol dehydrogenase family)